MGTGREVDQRSLHRVGMAALPAQLWPTGRSGSVALARTASAEA